MDVFWRYRNAVEQRLARHAVIAFAVVERYETLVAPEPVGALEWEGLGIGRCRKQGVKSSRRLSAGERDSERTFRPLRDAKHPIGRPLGKLITILGDIYFHSFAPAAAPSPILRQFRASRWMSSSASDGPSLPAGQSGSASTRSSFHASRIACTIRQAH